MRKVPFKDLTNDKGTEEFINSFHSLYIQRIKYYEIDNKELTRFAWAQHKCVSLYNIIVFSDDLTFKTSSILFAIPNQIKNKFFSANLVNETTNYTFGSINDADVSKRLSWIVSHKLLSADFIKQVCQASISFDFGTFKNGSSSQINIENWARSWVDKEYHDTSKELQNKNVIEPFPLSNQQYFVDRYHFDKMLKTLNDKQFTDEFNQCLFAYENNKWFICASGLGSCLEHLMEKIIINYNQKGYRTLRGLGKDPTFKDYLTIFRKPPINMEPRQETYIKMLSMARNSIDHHNTGYTKKNICDSLLDGIRNIFNDYYSSSILIKDAPKDEK